MSNLVNNWGIDGGLPQRAISVCDAGQSIDYSYSQISSCVDQQVEYFLTNGIKPGQYLALSTSSSLGALISFLALSKLGVGIYCPVRDASIELQVLKRLGINITITDRKEDALTEKVLVPLQQFQQGFVTSPIVPEDIELPWLIRSTSGTTGSPKVFVTSRAEAISRRQRYFCAVGIERGDSFYSFTPISFGAARQRIFYALNRGASVVFHQNTNISLKSKIATINKKEVSHLYCVPLFLDLLCRYAENNPSEVQPYLFPKVKCIESTSSLVTPELSRRIRTLLSPHFVNAYAVSETGHLSATKDSSKPDDELNDVGAPLKGVDLGIYDASFNRLPSGASGLIGVRIADTPPFKYFDQNFPKAHGPDGLFFPGDTGYLSQNGNLIIQGRSDDMMIFDGINIFPSEIESVMKELPGVIDAVAFPVPIEARLHLPCTALILDGSVSVEEISQQCTRVLGIRSPKVVFAVKSFPMDSRGKILRRKLQELVRFQIEKNKKA